MRRLLGGLTLLLVLAACGGEDEPRVADPGSDPPTSSTAPVTDPPTSTPTQAPEPETAQAFIRRWSVIERDMENTGDTTAYRALSDRCKGCDELAATVERYYGAGGTISWKGWRIIKIERFDRSQIEYKVKVDSSPTRYRKAAGAKVQRFTGGPAEWIIELRREGQSWVVTDKDQLVG